MTLSLILAGFAGGILALVVLVIFCVMPKKQKGEIRGYNERSLAALLERNILTAETNRLLTIIAENLSRI